MHDFEISQFFVCGVTRVSLLTGGANASPHPLKPGSLCQAILVNYHFQEAEFHIHVAITLFPPG